MLTTAVSMRKGGILQHVLQPQQQVDLEDLVPVIAKKQKRNIVVRWQQTQI